MFPLWLATVIIFYFLSGYWLWKLINIFIIVGKKIPCICILFPSQLLYLISTTAYCGYRWFYHVCRLTSLLVSCVDDTLLLLHVCLWWWVFSFHNSLVSSCGLFFFASRRCFNICCKAGLVVLNSFNFFLSIKLLISASKVLLLILSFSLSSLWIYPATPF